MAKSRATFEYNDSDLTQHQSGIPRGRALFGLRRLSRIMYPSHALAALCLSGDEFTEIRLI